jgi:NAD(P)H-dependent FMN reductase
MDREMGANLRLLLVSGSTRAGSTNTAALRTLRDLAPAGMCAVLYDEMAALPAFNPDDDLDVVPPAVARLREEIARADAVLLCTPEYAGTLPGSFKNLLDWTVGNGALYGKPVAWINVAAEGRGDGAHATPRTVLGYVAASVIEPARVQVPVPRDAIGPDGTIADPDVRARLVAVLDTVARAVSTPAEP